MLEIVGESIVKRLVDIAANAVEKKINLAGVGSTRIDTSASRTALEDHLFMISRWAAEISFRDLRKSKKLMDSFVDLDLTLGPIPTRRHNPPSRRLKVTDLLRYDRNFIILGDPGAGKTTTLKRLAFGSLTGGSEGGKVKVPILIRLRDLSSPSILSAILSTMGVNVFFDGEITKEAKETTTLRIVGQYLRNLNALLLIDGLDETPFRDRAGTVRNLRDLILHSKGYQVVVTCRTADFIYNLESAVTLAIEPLSADQIRNFATRWLGKSEGENLRQKIQATPYGGSEVLPLTLAHLCAIYERSGSIPEKPRTVYRKIVRLLLEEWDEQRSIRRDSRYSSFDIDRKEDFLKAIAFRLTLISPSSSFSHKELEHAYYDIYERFGLPKAEARKIAREIESHTGLIVGTGIETYEFAHKSIQEYLTAEYILKLPHVPAELSLRLPNEMALAVALSSDSNQYFAAVVVSVINRSKGTLEDFTYPFLRRVLIEKVDFRSTIRLGYSVLALYSETHFPTQGQLRLPINTGIDIFSDFLSQEPIRNAIKIVMQRDHLGPGYGETYRIIPSEEDEHSQFLLPASGQYTVDDRYLEFIRKGSEH